MRRADVPCPQCKRYGDETTAMSEPVRAYICRSATPAALNVKRRQADRSTPAPRTQRPGGHAVTPVARPPGLRLDHMHAVKIHADNTAPASIGRPRAAY
jgi:hypothetical protein